MRVRKRYAVMWAVAALAGLTIAIQALTAEPPEPAVRLASVERTAEPRISYICSKDGEEAMAYSGSSGRLIITPTGQPCDYEAWLANDGPNAGW